MLDFGFLAGPVGVAHDAFECFASGGAWKVRHEHDPTELLEAGFNALVDPGEEFGFGDAAWRMQNHGRHRRFPPARIGHPKDGHFPHRRVLDHNLLNIPRVHIAPPEMIMSFCRSTRYGKPSAST
jgi:hypothetical protein